MPNNPNLRKGTNDICNLHANYHDIDKDNQLSLSFLFKKAEFEVASIEIHEAGHIDLSAHCSLDYGICPYCGCVSRKVHSKYIRHPNDMPVIGLPLRLHLEMRKFFCGNPDCQHKTFAEQPGNETFWYRRRTRRCEVFVAKLSMSVSSISASSLLSFVGIPLSSSTILRDLHRIKVPENQEVKVVGVDDWAMRKGVTYGSIIVSMENGHPIDLLGSREQESFREWLRKHENVSVVSRDRSTEYSSAIQATGRPIVEVADHFHLILNMGECVTKIISENYSDYRNAIRPSKPPQESKNEAFQPQQTTGEPILQPEKPSQRQIIFDAVKEIQRAGGGINSTARQLGIARQTVRKYFQWELLPPMNSKARNEYFRIDQYVETEYKAGRTKHDIFIDIVENFGFKCSLTPFYDHYKYLTGNDRIVPSVKKKKEDPKRPKINPVVKEPLLPIRAISRIVDKFTRDKDMEEEDWKVIDILKGFDWFKAMVQATKTFYQMMKDRSIGDLVQWIKENTKSSIPKIKTFATGLKMDFDAVANCLLRADISNGIVEGFVNKLKVTKRIMYGRAKIPLLRVKVVMEHILFN